MNLTKGVFRSVVKVHLAGVLSDDFTTSLKGKLIRLMDEFHDSHDPREVPNKNVAFREYLQGTPTAINVEYTYDGFQRVIKEWYEKSNEEYVKRSAELEENFYYHTITREIREMCRISKVPF